MRIKLGVVFGGETVEHEISVISAVQAMNALDSEKYDIIPIYIAKDRIWYTGKMLMDLEVYKDFDNLKKYAKKCVMYKSENEFYLQALSGFKKIITSIDVIFPIVHGNNVEDGSLQGYFQTLGIPYVGSHVLGSALGQDKVVMKEIFKANHIPIVDYIWFYDNEYLSKKEEILGAVAKMGYPVVVKPATLGSSIGIKVANNLTEIEESIAEAFKYDIKIVIEKCVANLVEVNQSVLGDYENSEVSAIEEVMSTDEILSYKDKYIGGGKGSKSKGMASAGRLIPARISDEMSDKIAILSKEVFRCLNLSGICRIDYLIDSKTNEIYVNEPNTIPGSLSFYLWDPVGKPYDKLLDEAITLAIKDYKKRSKKTYSFGVNILSNFNGLKGGKGIKGIKGMKSKLR